jgi:hypothetical protein
MSISRKLLQTQPTGGTPIGGAYLVSTSSANITGIWTCPTDVTSVSVLCIGRGGEGRWSTNGGAGGGGGALAWVNNLTVTPGASYSVGVSTTMPQVVPFTTVMKLLLTVKHYPVGTHPVVVDLQVVMVVLLVWVQAIQAEMVLTEAVP